MFHADECAKHTREALGFKAPQRVETIARALFTITETSRGKKVRVVRDDRAGIWRMFVSRTLDAGDRAWEIAQATAAWMLRDAEDASAASRRLAVALLLPAEVVTKLADATSPERAAAVLRAPTSAVYLRLGELRQRPTALVIPPWQWSTKTGDAAGRLPPEKSPELHALVSMPTVGIEKVHVSEREVVLLAS